MKTRDDFDELLATAVHEPPLLIPGAKLAEGRFVISHVLGSGGMGVVYKGRDTTHDSDVAIKVLSRVEASGIYRLKQEFRSLSNILHENLVAMHELFEERGGWFFTMELIEGHPISHLVWTPSLLRHVFGQLAEGIEAIHGEGKLHRDLKPSNVMLTTFGRVVILDFGLVADQVVGGTGQTVADEGMTGTPAYMAPEQADALPSRASDWYSFGTMLYEALYGAPPFRQGGMAALVRKREQPAPPPPSTSGVPSDLAALCMDLLERDASRRPGYERIAAVVGKPAPISMPPHEADVFVGREHELDALWRALSETDIGRCAAVLVSGEPGIGKTTLVERFVASVRERLDGVVLRGICREQEHVPFKACDSLMDDLSRYLRKIPAEQAAYVLPRNAHALARVFPVFERLPSVSGFKPRHALPRDPAEVKRLGLAALRELIGNIAARERLVVFVDDLHWADADGARLLASLVTQPGAPALLLVVCYRTPESEQAGGLGAFLDRLVPSDDLHVEKLQLRGLSDRESHQLAAGLLEQRCLPDRIAQEAGGNPLLIRQILGHAIESDDVPVELGLEEVIRARLDRLEPRERDALQAISLAHGPISLSILAQVTSDPDQERLVRKLETMRLARMVPGEHGQVTWFHDRIRQLVLGHMTSERSRAVHARFVEVLTRCPERDLAALALHTFGSGQMAEASACALRAAHEAEATLAFEQAAGMYRAVLAWRQRDPAVEVELLVRLAENLVWDARSAEGAEAFVRAAALEPDPLRRRSLELRAAESFFTGGRMHRAIELLKKTMAEIGLDYDAIRALSPIDLRRQLAGRGVAMVPRPESEIDPRDLQRLEALEVAGSGLAFIKSERLQFRFVLALEALEAGAPIPLATGLSTVASVDAQLAPGDTQIRRAVEAICDACPGEQADWIRASMDMSTAFVEGRPWAQCAAARRSEELLLQRSRRDAHALSHARYHEALSMQMLGQLRELHDRALPWLEEAEHRSDYFLCSWLNTLLAHHELAADRPLRARKRCEKASRICEMADGGPSMLRYASMIVLGLCEAYEGDMNGWDRIRRMDPSGIFPALSVFKCLDHSYRAIVSLLVGEEAPAEESIAILAQTGSASVLPHFRILSTLYAGGLAARRGDDESAVALLERGLEQLAIDASYRLFSAYARRRLGLLWGGRRGESMIAPAEEELARLGVKNPARHERVVLPGYAA